MAVTKSQAKKTNDRTEKVEKATLSIVTRSKSGKTSTKVVTLESNTDFAILGKCYINQLEKSKKVASPKKNIVSSKKVASPKKNIVSSKKVASLSQTSPIKGTSIIKTILKNNPQGPEGIAKADLIQLAKRYTISKYFTDKIITQLIEKGEVELNDKTGLLTLVNTDKSPKKSLARKRSPTKEESFKRNIIEAILASKGKKMTKLALLKSTNIDNDMLAKLLDELIKDNELNKVKQSYVVLKNNYETLSPKEIEDIIFEEERSPISKPKKSLKKNKKEMLPIKGSPIRSPTIPEFTRSQERNIERIFGIFEDNQREKFTIQSLMQVASEEYDIEQNVLDKTQTILDILINDGRVREIKKKGKPTNYVISDEYKFSESEREDEEL
jgi:predicted transcriptional regulator